MRSHAITLLRWSAVLLLAFGGGEFRLSTSAAAATDSPSLGRADRGPAAVVSPEPERTQTHEYRDRFVFVWRSAPDASRAGCSRISASWREAEQQIRLMLALCRPG